MKEGEEEDAKKIKTEADLLEEEQIKKEAEIKREESRIKRENIWKKRTVRNSCPELHPFKSIKYNFLLPSYILSESPKEILFRLVPSSKKQLQHIGGEEPRRKQEAVDNTDATNQIHYLIVTTCDQQCRLYETILYTWIEKAASIAKSLLHSSS